MNWKSEAAENLRLLNTRKVALENIKARIRILEMDYEAFVHTSAARRDRVSGGEREDEAIRLNNIVERECLEMTYKAARELVSLTERGLAGLGRTERTVLERFYVDRKPGHAESLMEEFGYEQSHIYRLKDEALKKFTLAMYGVERY